MAKYTPAPCVREELWEIWHFIAKDNPDAADRVVEAAESTFQELANHPGLGRPRSFRKKAHRNLRSRSVTGFENYLILYREVTGGIEILHVMHAGRNLGAILKQDR